MVSEPADRAHPAVAIDRPQDVGLGIIMQTGNFSGVDRKADHRLVIIGLAGTE